MAQSMKICIDAGHGMGNRRLGVYDPGATAGHYSEADIVLHIALTGKWYCEKVGIPVFLTRDDDRDPDPVGTRDDRAEAAGCSHFIALHCNAANGAATGTETFYRDGADRRFAQKVQDAALLAWELKSRGLKTEADSQHSRLAVFDFDGPSALLEVGFIDNELDRPRMMSRDRRIKFWEKLIASLTARTEL